MNNRYVFIVLLNLIVLCFQSGYAEVKNESFSRFISKGVLTDLRVSPSRRTATFKLRYEQKVEVFFYDLKNRQFLDFTISSLLKLGKNYEVNNVEFDKEGDIFFSLNHVSYTNFKSPKTGRVSSRHKTPQYLASGAIYHLQLSTRTIKKVMKNPVTDKKGIVNVDLSPTGKGLIYLASSWPKYDLYYYPLDSGKIKLLDTDIYYPFVGYKSLDTGSYHPFVGHKILPMWLENSREIAYVKHNSIYLTDTNGNNKLLAKFDREKEKLLRFYSLPQKLVCITSNLEEAALNFKKKHPPDIGYSFWVFDLENNSRKLVSKLTSSVNTHFEVINREEILISVTRKSLFPKDVINTELYKYNYVLGTKKQIPSLKCNSFKQFIIAIIPTKELIYYVAPYIKTNEWKPCLIILQDLEKGTIEKLVGKESKGCL